MRVKKIIACILITSTFILTSCSSNNSNNIESNISDYEVRYNVNEIHSNILELIQTGNITNPDLFDNTFEFDSYDMYTDNSKIRVYFTESAYYIQTGLYMYRFQLNEQGLIESYIKYNIEA